MLSAGEPVAHTCELVRNGRIQCVGVPRETIFDESTYVVKGVYAERRFGGAQHSLGAPLLSISAVIRALDERQCFSSERVDGCRVVFHGCRGNEFWFVDTLELCPGSRRV